MWKRPVLIDHVALLKVVHSIVQPVHIEKIPKAVFSIMACS